MKKKVLELSSILLILCVFFVYVYEALSFKYGDGILGLKYLYQLENDSVDVLVLGSSHAFEDINTQILYDEYGVASYILAGSVQPFWNSYYYLQEALKTQTPKLVVLEGFAATLDFEYSDYSRIIKNNFGIRDKISKIKSIRVSSPVDELDNYIFDWRFWHSRYEELNSSDFKDYYQKPKFLYYKGFGINFETTVYDAPDVDSFIGNRRINAKEEKYFRKIIELCQKNSIPVKVVISPYVLNQSEQQCFNYLEKIAKEYNVDFINYNSTAYYKAMQLDFATDMADLGHLNYIGSAKYTRILAEYITDTIKLPDRRNNSDYQTWRLNSKDIIERVRDTQIANALEIRDFLTNYSDGKDLVAYIYTISDTEKINNQTEIFNLLQIPDKYIQDGGFYCIKGNSFDSILGSDMQWDYTEKLHDDFLSAKHSVLIKNGDINIQRTMSYEGNQYIDDAQGIYIFIYNQFTRSLVCVKQVIVDTNNGIDLVSK